MDSIIADAQQRLAALREMRRSLERQIRRLPGGSLYISQSNGSVQFYRRHAGGAKDYISVKNDSLIRGLAQKDYYAEVIRAVDAEMRCLERMLRTYPAVTVEEVWPKMHDERKMITEPLFEPDDMYVEKWLHKQYDRKGFSEGFPEYYTDNGERVRSKSEILIANQFLRSGVPYRYEYPVYLEGYGMFNPDFTALNVRKRIEIIWDHYGMMDDPGYAEDALQKRVIYNRNGYYEGDRLLITYESSRMPLNVKDVRALIDRYLL